MSHFDHEYRALPEQARQAVNDLTNELFRQKSGFQGKIDPRKRPDLVRQWTDIRDQILEKRDQIHQLLQAPLVQSIVTKVASILSPEAEVPAWIITARAQLGVHEIKGSEHNPKIMAYIYTCSNILQTANERKFVAREGEEGVEWCSAFVNWCLEQNGITGTDNALASSWKNWGTELKAPKRGAICGFNWNGGKSIAHVGFCDEENGQLLLLGGNQTDPNSGGRVSRVSFPNSSARYYRWPPMN